MQRASACCPIPTCRLSQSCSVALVPDVGNLLLDLRVLTALGAGHRRGARGARPFIYLQVLPSEKMNLRGRESSGDIQFNFGWRVRAQVPFLSQDICSLSLPE